MIELELCREDLGSRWAHDASGWSAGQSQIRPFPHPALEAHAFATQGRTLFVVRERCGRRGMPSPGPVHHLSAERFARVLADAREWSLELLLVLLSHGEDGTEVSLECGGWGTAPVYLLESQERLRVHWDPASLYPHCRTRSLAPELAAQFLIEGKTSYSRRTLFPDIQQLTERARAHWGGREGTLRIDYPPAVEPVAVGTLRDGVDVLGTFEHILAGSMRRWLDAEDPIVATELSGGLDSAIVAAVGSRLSPSPVRTFGMLMPGEPGEGQRRRRQELIARFGCEDWSFPAAENLPLSAAGDRLRGGRIVPWEECYVEAFQRMLGRVAAQGVAVLFTGVGGNELCFLHYEEMSSAEREALAREVVVERADAPAFVAEQAYRRYRDSLRSLDRAPRARMPDSGLQAAAAGSALYLAQGIWQVHPLCTPELVRFCERLPREWREARALERRLLARKGCSRAVTHPQATENFSPLMQLAVRQTARRGLERLFRDSRLAAAGLVDGQKMIDSYAEYGRTGRPGDEFGFYNAAVLELTLRALDP